MFVEFSKHHAHTHTVSLIPPWEDQCEWHRMTRMTGPDSAVMCSLINTHTHAQGGEHKVLRAQVKFVQVERVYPLCRV